MKKFNAKVIVKLKPSIKDVKGQTIKTTIECIEPVNELTCHAGSVYWFTFEAENQAEALNFIEKIAKDILSNEVIEMYEIRYINEVDEQD